VASEKDYIDTVKLTGECYVIATSTELGPAVPYPSADHQDGNFNYGFADLREQPELIEKIPEAQGKPGLLTLLRTINSPGSPIMSVGCANGIFTVDIPVPNGPQCYIGSYIDVAFRDVTLATEDNLLAFSKSIIAQRKPTNRDWTTYELVVQPMRHFFGKPAFNLMLKIMTHAPDEPMAWKSFNAQCVKMSEALEQLK